MPYLPPHLRPGYKPEPKKAPSPTRRKAHFKSNTTGLPTHNLTIKLYNRDTPFKTPREIRKQSLKSKLKRKSSLKKTLKKTRLVKSASLKNKRVRNTLKAKSH
jgi:hypothetical protein